MACAMSHNTVVVGPDGYEQLLITTGEDWLGEAEILIASDTFVTLAEYR